MMGWSTLIRLADDTIDTLADTAAVQKDLNNLKERVDSNFKVEQ